MATFIVLITETQKGEQHIQESVARALNFKEMAKDFNVTVTEQYWCLGECDGVLIFDAPDDETAAALLQSLTSKGAVRTRTMRAFSADEMKAIVSRMEG